MDPRVIDTLLEILTSLVKDYPDNDHNRKKQIIDGFLADRAARGRVDEPDDRELLQWMIQLAGQDSSTIIVRELLDQAGISIGEVGGIGIRAGDRERVLGYFGGRLQLNRLPEAMDVDEPERQKQKLPNEILCMITEYFAVLEPEPPRGKINHRRYDLATLGSLRLVNKALHSFATPYMFEIVTVSGDINKLPGKLTGLVNSGYVRYMQEIFISAPNLPKEMRDQDLDAQGNLQMIPKFDPQIDLPLWSDQFRKLFYVPLRKLFSACKRPLRRIAIDTSPDFWWENHYMVNRSTRPAWLFHRRIGLALGSAEHRSDMSLQIKTLTIRGRFCNRLFGDFGSCKDMASKAETIHIERVQDYNYHAFFPENQDLNNVLKWLSKMNCTGVTLGNWSSWLLPCRFELTPRFCHQLTQVRLYNMKIHGEDLFDFFSATKALHVYSMHNVMAVQLGGGTRWGDIFRALSSLTALESVEFSALRTCSGCEWASPQLHKVPVSALNLYNLYNPRRTGPPYRPLESKFSQDYVAFEKLVRTLLERNPREKGQMEAYLQPHVLHDRAWIRTRIHRGWI